MVSESTASGEKKKEEGEGGEEGGEEVTGGGSSSTDSVNIHVEAVVSSLGLLLYSDVGGVAEVNVKGQLLLCVYWSYHNNTCDVQQVLQHQWICMTMLSAYRQGKYIESLTIEE